MKKLLACLLVVATSGCPEIKVDPDEVGGGPVVEFDPARTQAVGARFIPFPNDLARDPATGKVNLPVQACESAAAKATREQLNKLDGFGAYEVAMQVTFTQPVDPASLTDHIVMYQLTKQGVPQTPSASTQPVPIRVVRVATTPRFSTGDCEAVPEEVNAVTFVPLVPLEQKSTYFVALLKGITDTSGAEFKSTFTWELVKSTENPVTVNEAGIIVSDRTPLDPSSAEGLASLLALNSLWKLHAPGIAFTEAATGKPRADILVGFQFTTQTITSPLDRSVPDSPAGMLSTNGVLQAMTAANRFGPASAFCGAEAGTVQCFLKLALGGCSPLTTGCSGQNYIDGGTACALASCSEIGDVIGGGVLTANYQTQLDNPLPGGAKILGAWSDPYHPEIQNAFQVLETIIVKPAAAAPSGGYPVIVFAHGLTSSKESVLAIAGRFAAAGFVTVAIDAAAHGSRAVRTSKELTQGCIGRCFPVGSDTPTATECDTTAECGANETCGTLSPTAAAGFVPPSPTTASQCYAPFLSPDLAATRDSIRQTVLDHERVILALKTCATMGCTNVPALDGSKIYFVGFSLGGFIGTVSGAMADVNVVGINAGGVGWADFLENTETLAIRCLLVNGLIDAGILKGEKWTGGTTGLCTTDAWKAQPGYATFAATGRWMLDPADGANFTTRLAPKRLLIQEIIGDTVIPNLTTNNLAALVGLTPKAADVAGSLAPPASAAITTMPTTNKFVTYTTSANNIFAHPSLLRPVTQTTPGVLGTVRLQVDLTTFLGNQ